ncbi:MAG: acyl-CoA carboxylase subunit beta [Acidobacteria bacterium]|nr:acyl-CoA carboxylase subunit beta [Acidobacteriota bacterium]
MGRKEYQERLNELEQKVRGGEPGATRKQQDEGKLTARERIQRLLDPNTFLEEFMLAQSQATDFGMAQKRQPGDGVVTGYGKIGGRPVCVFAQDRTLLAGAVGSTHAEKISHAIRSARQQGIPLIGLYDSAGARIQEGLDVTKAIGSIFFENSLTSGVVPQISAIMGPCIGVAAYSPALTDLVLMVQGSSHMFITGPAVIKEVVGEEITMEELGGSRIHSEISGVADYTARDDSECLQTIRRLLSFLPSNFEAPPPRVDSGDSPNRLLTGIEETVPDDFRRAYNVLDLIRMIVDGGDFLELKPKFARNVVIGLGRLDGHSVGIIANQPMFLAGSLDADASDKAARFIRFCDAFNLPLITLMDVPGFLPGKQQEQKGIIRHGAKLLYAYAEATVPKITVALRKGYGGAKLAMCTREMGADRFLVWPAVELAVMGGEGAVNVIFKREIEQSEDPEKTRQQKMKEYAEKFSGPFDALSKQVANAALRPDQTRCELIRSLDMLLGKKEERPRKKHSLMPV